MANKFGLRELTVRGNQIFIKGDLITDTQDLVNDGMHPIYLAPIPVLDRVHSKVQAAVEQFRAENEGRRIEEIEIEAIRSPIIAEDPLYVALMKFMEAVDDEIEKMGLGG
jgi:hypothetical protein